MLLFYVLFYTVIYYTTLGLLLVNYKQEQGENYTQKSNENYSKARKIRRLLRRSKSLITRWMSMDECLELSMFINANPVNRMVYSVYKTLPRFWRPLFEFLECICIMYVYVQLGTPLSADDISHQTTVNSISVPLPENVKLVLVGLQYNTIHCNGEC